MSEQISFTKIENDLRPAYRNRLNTAESPEDVKKFFVYTAREFLSRALGNTPVVEYEDVRLAPDADPAYLVSERLSQHSAYSALQESSDLAIILNRLAQKAARRYVHLEKNPAKSESKIRG